jgi:cytochrome c6
MAQIFNISMHKCLLFAFCGFWVLLHACGGRDSASNAPNARHDQALVPDGMAIFRKNCVTCHGSDGMLGLNGAKDLSVSEISLAERIDIITHGKKLMTPYKSMLSPAEIEAVATYTQTLQKK